MLFFFNSKHHCDIMGEQQRSVLRDIELCKNIKQILLISIIIYQLKWCRPCPAFYSIMFEKVILYTQNKSRSKNDRGGISLIL